MPKLHEILAVEGDLAGTAKKLLDETRDTFAKKPTHFLASVEKTSYFDEVKAENLNKTEHSAMTTTVGDKLAYIAPALARYYDVYAAKESTNQTATADVVLPSGATFLKAIPATVLLGMETKLKELRAVYEAIPTLAPGVSWKADPDAGYGVYKAEHAEQRFVTEKSLVPVVMAPATDKHPAQVQAVTQDLPVAKKEIFAQSGMLSPADKSDALGRIDTLIRSVKEARQRANAAEAVKVTAFGSAIMDFINGDLVDA